jgi:hypothetical protein
MRARGLAGAYRTPGGVVTSAFAWLASLVSFTACFVANPRWSSVTVGVLALFLGGFLFRRRAARAQSG